MEIMKSLLPHALNRLRIVIALCLVGFLTSKISAPLRAQSTTSAANEPQALVSARENYERQFVKEVGVLQDKYRDALEQYLRKFTTAGKIDSALEAKNEIRRVKYWRTIPVKGGSRPMKVDSELNSLLQNYENAVLQTIEPISARYQAELERLKTGMQNSGDLEGTVKVEEELNRVKSRAEFPIQAGLRTYLSGLSREAFQTWLQDSVLEFSGASAGKTKLTFTENTMTYDSATARAPVTYTYKLTSNRSLAIEESSFKIDLAKDLLSGTFSSSQGTYELRITMGGEENPSETRQP